jgi:hypothetical protein
MKVDFYSADLENTSLVLTLELRDGKVVSTFGHKSMADWILNGKYGENPGQMNGFTAEDGENFLRVLPYNFSGHRFFAVFTE